MAAFDSKLSQIVIRIVYDGAGVAGKTSNLLALQEMFTENRRSELTTPETTRGRTLYFDHLVLEGGLIAGYRFRSELWTVPGQEVLRHRREFLLHDADVVVLVVDSRPSGVEIARGRRETLYACVGNRQLPVVIQANRQDEPTALKPVQVRAELGWGEDTPVIGAVASEGTGVRETALWAMRSAVRSIGQEVLLRGLDSMALDVESPANVLSRMQALPLDVPRADSFSPKPPLAEIAGAEGGEQAEVRDEATRAALATGPIGLPQARLPSPEVPSFQIWPPSSGRATLGRIPYAQVVLRKDLQHSELSEQDSKALSYVYRAGDWCLKTSPDRCYETLEEGRAHLIRLARFKVALGECLAPQTVLALQESPVGYWLWTVSPWYRSLHFEMVEADAVHSEDALALALRRYAEASVQALVLARESRVGLQIHPSNFAYADGQVLYLGDRIERAALLPSIGYDWLKRIEELGVTHPDAMEAYVDELEAQILRWFGREDVVALDLQAAVDETLVNSELARRVRERLLQVVNRCA